MKTTNYYDTLIEVADDCPIKLGEIPPNRTELKSVALLEYEMLMDNPYQFTSDDILFRVHAIRKEINEKDHKSAREKFFNKGQACFRSSPLTKRYGWGVHSNAEGKIAIYAMDSAEYGKLLKEKILKKVKAMRNKKR